MDNYTVNGFEFHLFQYEKPDDKAFFNAGLPGDANFQDEVGYRTFI
jgi:hypothetical protein